MSDDPLAPDTAAIALPPASWFHRARYTPLSDAVRGKLTARLDVKRIISTASLPKPLADITWRVIRGTRLWRIEKAAVAQELTSHFLDGLDAGKTADELLEAFGNPRIAAKLIRRAKKRARPWTWKSVKGAMYTFTAIVLLYAMMWTAILLRKPAITMEYYDAYDAKLATIPQEHRAWPAYREVFEKYDVVHMDLTDLGWVRGDELPEPGTPRWRTSEAYLASHADLLRDARQAMAYPHMGVSLMFPYDASQHDIELLMREDAAKHTLGLIDQRLKTPLFSADTALSVSPFSNLQLLVERDMVSAAHARDGDRYIADAAALLGLARQRGNRPSFIQRLGGLLRAREVYVNIIQVLSNDASWLSDEQIATLRKLIDKPVTTNEIDVDYLTLGIDDWLARYYTAGGKQTLDIWRQYKVDHAEPYQATVEMLGGILDSEQLASDIVVVAVVPWLLFRTPDADDIRGELDRVIVDALRDVKRPMWEWSPKDNVYRKKAEKWTASPERMIRYGSLRMLGSTVYEAALYFRGADADRQATLVVIALEQYRRDHGRYPEELSALEPDYMAELPLDLSTGKPLLFKVGENGKPIIYGRGRDGDDDGGVQAPDTRPMREPAKDGDWVLVPMVTN